MNDYYLFYLASITLLSFCYFLAFSFLTRKIEYANTETDNHLQIRSALESHTWKWISDMHNSENVKTYMKDMTVLLIMLFQKILKDKTSDHVLVTACAFSNMLSSILLYLIGNHFFGPHIGFVMACMFLFSLWPWQIALFGGHVAVSHPFFLLSAYFLLQAGDKTFGTTEFWLMLGGAVFGLTQFASASARKYIIAFFAILFFVRYQHLWLAGEYGFILNEIGKNFSPVFHVMLPLFYLLILGILFVGYKKTITAAYFQKAPRFINAIISAREKFSLEHYLKHAKERIWVVSKKSFMLVVWSMALVFLIGARELVAPISGFFLTVLLFTLPNVKKNIRWYFYYYYFTNKKGHFRIYREYFEKLGKPIRSTARGQGNGMRWIFKYFWLIAPFHCLLFVMSIAIVVSGISAHAFNPISAGLLLLLSLSPVIWGEATHSPQLGRTYSPGLVGMIFFTGYALSGFVFSPLAAQVFALFLVALIFYNQRELWHDIYPARMGSTELISALDKLGIKEFYTYKTDFTNAFINCIRKEILGRFTIRPIQTLSDLRDGWLVIPGTSSKAFNMESEMEGVRGGDFTRDRILNTLLDAHALDSIAAAKIKTFGTSFYWGHESEVPSYRDLILGEVKDQDRYRGYGWIVHADKLKKYISEKKYE